MQGIWDAQENRRAEVSELILREVGDLETLLRLIATDDGVVEGLQAEPVLNQDLVARTFSRFGQTVKNFLQIRWIDDSGIERVRVDFSGQEAYVVPDFERQNKSGRYYFIESQKIMPPDIYISPIDLNVENGSIVTPFQPTFRLALQTGIADSLPKGVLIVNYNLGPLLKRISDRNNDVTASQVLNPEGYWLLHPQKSKEWGWVLGNRNTSLLKQNPDLWFSMQHSDSIVGEHFDGALTSYRRLLLSGDPRQDGKFFYVMTQTPESVIEEYRWLSLQLAAMVTFLLLMVGGYCVWWDYRTRVKVAGLNLKLREEKDELAKINADLDRSLAEQQSLQHDLVESKRLASLGMTVAGVAHELNTPIGGAQLAVSGLQEKINDLKQALNAGLTRSALDGYVDYSEESVKMSMANLERANAVVHSFKRFSLERTHDDIVEFPLLQLVKDLQLSLKPRLKNSNVTLVDQVSPQLRLKTNPGLLSQALENLIVNALSHGYKAGQAGTIWVKANLTDNGYAEIHVQDDGEGIAPDIKEREFDPFVTTARGKGHTGLGLHLVHQWVTKHLGGSIRCVDTAGAGALFIIRLPVTLAAPVSSLEPSS